MSFPTGPLRVTASQWADISEHYDQEEPDDWSGYADELDDEEFEPAPDAHLEAAFEDSVNGGAEVDYDFYHAQWDYEPSPYDGTYSEE